MKVKIKVTRNGETEYLSRLGNLQLRRVLSYLLSYLQKGDKVTIELEIEK